MLLPLTLVIAFGLFYITGAQAVHGADIFELDTLSANAQTGVLGTTGPASASEDWDLICKANLGAGKCQFKAGYTQPAGTTSATASSFASDGNLNATIFQGGGSKDPEPIANWLWKDGAGGLPDKDNLLDAYAARYSVPSSADCPVFDPQNPGTPNTNGSLSCDVIYFGSDRYDNSGDATQAFWFLQNRIAADGPASQGGFKFTGSHKDGDLLVISEFSNGGTTSTVTVYKWTGNDATGSLTFLSGGDNKSCSLVSSPDPFCGIVNTVTGLTISPWVFTDKSGNSNFAQGELFEAGINISAPGINLGGECFSSFVAETRSSTSTTATLKDFVLGGFQQCSASVSSNQDWLPSDRITVSVGGQSSWGGLLSVKLISNASCTLGTAGANVLHSTSQNITQSTGEVTITAPAAQKVSASASRSWLVDFDPDTTTAGKGVPNPDPVCESTVLTINNTATIVP